jgi:predicted nucleic acid-binding protein
LILVDSSVWIDFFRNKSTAEARWLYDNLSEREILLGDLILAEVLRGFQDDRAFSEAKRLLSRLLVVPMVDEEVAVQSAIHFRELRKLGVTLRGTIDTIIATRCLVDGFFLLHSDHSKSTSDFA